mmetsp:Transcript_99104/g.171832  ORF Transcript_99104/g.171832 Transcript_99104/m.171832 type:complete len:278 (-) Transcript_99104:73-906(-)
MPHFLISRARSGIQYIQEFLYGIEFPAKGSAIYSYSIEAVEIVAAIIFIIGSVCFLPQYSKNVEVFMLGCNLFIVGAVGYVVICGMTLIEAWGEKKGWTFEVWENLLYLVGSVVFVFGTVLYFPERDHCEHVGASVGEDGTCSSLAQEVNKGAKEWYGTLLFILGSMIFVVAVFLNALNQRKFILWQHQIVCVITMFYMLGSVLFCMGSVAFLPDVGCGPEMVLIGAWMFIVGSVLFFLASLLSLWRTSYMLNHPEEDEEEDALLANSEAKSSGLKK